MHSASNMDYQTLFLQIKTHLQQSGEGRLSSDMIVQSQHNINQKLANLQPSIMLYGIYNAGKSTLLNALLGQNQANVSDRPETSTINEYVWQSYRIFDTPGVDAPIEHQQITEQHLQQVEVVLFVMSTNGAFDESDIYHRLAAVLKNGQQLIIVLNDKIGTSETDKHSILQRVSEHLSKQLNDSLALLKDVSVIALNAKTALKGRLEKKALLIEKSNIGQLEATIHQKMAQTSLQDSLRTLAQLCLTPLEALIRAITQELTESQEQALIQQLNAMGLLKQNLEIEIEHTIGKYMPLLQQELSELLYEGSNSAEELQQTLCQIIDKYGKAILEQYSQALGNYSTMFKLNIEDILHSKILAQQANHQAPIPIADTPTKQIFNTLLEAGGVAVMASDNPLIGAAMIAGSSLLEKRTLLNSIMSFVFRIFSGSNEADLQARLLNANKEAGSIRYEIERELHTKLTAYTDDIIDNIAKPLADSKHILDDTSKTLLHDREKTRELETQLRQLVGQ